MSQTIGLSQGSLEERFAHILQPIRDLAKNWDIDIANYLEEYLDDLEKVEITFDDGATTMNFSEAALLIQGSAGVYAKKVEYLYALVFQVLDLVTQNKRQKGKQGEKGANPEEDEANCSKLDEEFLPLDDDVCGDDTNYVKEQDASVCKSVRPVPEMPTRLIPLEEAEKGDNSIYNKKGEVLGNHCDFNIDMGYICSNGSIVLEMADMALVDLHALAGDERNRCREESGVDNYVEDDNNADPGFVDNFEDELMDINQGEEMEALQSNNNKNSNNIDDTNVQGQKRTRRQKKVTFGEPSNEADKKKTKDPFALLDPYEKSKAADRPFRKKKTCKVPEGLSEKAPKKRKKKVVKSKQELAPLHEVVEKVFSNASKFPKNKLKVPEFPEMEDAFWEEYKFREKLKAEEMKELKKRNEEETEDNDNDAEDEPERENFPDLDGGNDDEIDNIPPIQLDEDLFRNESNNLRLRPLSTETGYNTLGQDDVTVTYEDLVQMHVEKYLASASEYAQITELSRRVSEWEEKITPTLEEEQTHPSFDIHKYGSVMIEKMVRGEMIAFRDLVKGVPLFEVCRYALAVLQLANAYNVELTIKPETSGSLMDCLYVTLLSTKRHYEDLQEYQAPSLKDS